MRKKEATILIVDDDNDVLFSAKMWLKRFFSIILTTSSPKKIADFFNDYEIDTILLDMNYRKGYEDGKEGTYWLTHILETHPETTVILMTAFGAVDLAVESIKRGAADFILKPWSNEKLYASVNAAVDLSRKNKKIEQFEKVNQRDNVTFIGKSNGVKIALELANKVAPTDATVLILGENGTGKYVFAKEIHQKSNRKHALFIHVDLGALNDSLFESELFGYAKGAFTDAKESTLGRFELANGGTIFLDEIGNLSLASQTKLLTVIQNRKINRLGEAKERNIDVRIICATNAPIYKNVKKGTFRKDLLFRINTIEVNLPPLREREKDITLLALHFLEKFKLKYQKEAVQFTENALSEMEHYNWPGNIREMENVLERAVILCDNNDITAFDLRFSPLEIESTTNQNLHLETMEAMLIKKAIKKHHGNITKAANDLGLNRTSLYRRMEKHNLK